MNLREYADRDMLAIDVANMLAGELETALLHHDTVSLAVPGGTTPGPIFDVLCAADLEWDRVHVLPTDERCVPLGNDRSNARLIAERLLVNRAAKARFLPLYEPADDPTDGLTVRGERITALRPLSVLMLGMGSDMHTASLFPGMPGLAAALDAHAPAVTIAQPETQPETRVTLTAPVLNGALSKHLVIFGPDKRAVLERAMTLPPEEAPIAAVLDGITVHWAE
ncbi:6-phosphogluconolactonase [Ruegeria sp. 2012CJ41-6]|uniref:6-phosphogluconolactonase n=1 Tax=Ruegeria spongiae TaxID=2942209 RepID=A0ABT0PWS8_9RHOB|nr:6-phosphogluconolactonase [Ruegeria spongiae]MCL6282048.1 6-phosphogluconolactonase [Ruegeria spongiae]